MLEANQFVYFYRFRHRNRGPKGQSNGPERIAGLFLGIMLAF
jgi:hypothetical protein